MISSHDMTSRIGLEKVVLLSFRGYLGEIESEKP